MLPSIRGSYLALRIAFLHPQPRSAAYCFLLPASRFLLPASCCLLLAACCLLLAACLPLPAAAEWLAEWSAVRRDACLLTVCMLCSGGTRRSKTRVRASRFAETSPGTQHGTL